MNVINYWLIFLYLLRFFFHLKRGREYRVCFQRFRQINQMQCGALQYIICTTYNSMKWNGLSYIIHLKSGIPCEQEPKLYANQAEKKWNERCFGMCLTRSIQFNNSVAVIDFFSLSRHAKSGGNFSIFHLGFLNCFENGNVS